jgi:hypothetical protein
MKITWRKLNTDYQVCYKSSQTLRDIDCVSSKIVLGANTSMTILDNLNEATSYNVAVRAKAKERFGDLGPSIRSTTLEDSK